jgi:uncharacterized membrane protein
MKYLTLYDDDGDAMELANEAVTMCQKRRAFVRAMRDIYMSEHMHLHMKKEDDGTNTQGWFVCDGALCTVLCS